MVVAFNVLLLFTTSAYIRAHPTWQVPPDQWFTRSDWRLKKSGAGHGLRTVVHILFSRAH